MADRAAEVWFVYIIRCADGPLYTGITTDLARRTRQHNAGTAARYTRSLRPVKLVYQESQGSQSLALKREAAIEKADTAEETDGDPTGPKEGTKIRSSSCRFDS